VSKEFDEKKIKQILQQLQTQKKNGVLIYKCTLLVFLLC
jgi:hypothetical protein